MLSWVSPLWLLGVALLPAIRWLHRGGVHRRVVRVSHLGLWRGSPASPPAAGRRQPPDPAWRRRALLALLLFVTLAEPQLPQRHPQVTLWVDDSLSMLTLEPAQPARTVAGSTGHSTSSEASQDTRLVAGLAKARAQLEQFAHGAVAVRALSDPWRDLGPLTDGVVATLAAGTGQKEGVPPPAALLHTDTLNWLVTDGADATLVAWPNGRRPDRLIQVAHATRNVGLERLSARRSPADAERLDLLLKLVNGGSAVETRELVVSTDAGEVGRSTHRLDPGTSAFASVSIPATSSVRAVLQPNDALAQDDSIALDLAALRRHRVAFDRRCPPPLVAAVDAHPALALAPQDASDVEAVLDCGSNGIAPRAATVQVIAQRTPAQVSGPVTWASSVPGSRRVGLDSAKLHVAAQLHARPDDTVLLAAGNAPVIIARKGPSKLIETSIDFGTMAATAGPEIPLLVNLLFEQLFDKTLLDEIAITDRGAAASRVAPQAGVEQPAGAPQTTAAPVLRDGTKPLLLAALLVLLWEIVALARQSYRIVKPARAGSA